METVTIIINGKETQVKPDIVQKLIAKGIVINEETLNKLKQIKDANN